MRRRVVLLVLLVAFAVPASARGVLYKCRDADGRTVLRDRHCPAGEQEIDRQHPMGRRFALYKPLPHEASQDRQADTAKQATPVPSK